MVGRVLSRGPDASKGGSMANRREIESNLLDKIIRRMEEVSEERHRLARHDRLLRAAATQLRLGRSAEIVLAEIREQSPTLLRDYGDLQLTPTAVPLRSPGRLAASA
jgi:hypothetical protein